MAFVLKHGKKQTKPFIRKVEVCCTGIELTYCDEKQALRFVSRAAAIHVAKALAAYGNFYPVEVEG